MAILAPFLLQGTAREIAHALFVISEAIDRYKALCEGDYCGAPAPNF